MSLLTAGHASHRAVASPSASPTLFVVTVTADTGSLVGAGNAPDSTNDGICNDTVAGVTQCTLRSALKSAFESAGPEGVTIEFAPVLSGTVITLVGNAVQWAASNTTVDARDQVITISGVAMNASQPMFIIDGVDNELFGVKLVAARSEAIRIVDSTGSTVGARNRISGVTILGSLTAAVRITGGASANEIVSNRIGIQAPNSSACAAGDNNSVGVWIDGGAYNNAVRANQINCNSAAGVRIDGGVSTANNTVYENAIGVRTVAGPGGSLGNGFGIWLQGSRLTTVSNNIIRGNSLEGIFVVNANPGLLIVDNYFGDILRTPLANTDNNAGEDILIDSALASGVTIDRNKFINNPLANIRISAADTITVSNNLIGDTGTYTGSAPIGIELINGANKIKILSNTISYASNVGIALIGVNTRQNVLQNNQIRFGGNGIELSGGARENAIGAETFLIPGLVAGNIITANRGIGILLSGSATRLNLLCGNAVGTAEAGNGTGIELRAEANSNQIGGPANCRNTVRGNTGNGILLDNASSNSIFNNGIGQDPPVVGARANSASAAGNGSAGLRLRNGSSDNAIEENTLAANAGGIILEGATTQNNTFLRNLSIDNAGDGLAVLFAPNNNFGSAVPDDGNIFSNNGRSGIYVAGANGNKVGFGATRQNADYGVIIDTANVTLKGIAVSENGLDGIGQRNGTNSFWTRLSVLDNGGLGIDNSAASDSGNVVDDPGITTVTYTYGTAYELSGTGATAGGTLEVYVADRDPSGFGEGRTYLGDATVDASGAWVFAVPATYREEPCFTVMQTVAAISSEFGRALCRQVAQSITFTLPATITFRPGTLRISAETSSGLEAVFTSDTPAVCTVTSGGVLTLLSTGTCTITASQPGNEAYLPATPVTRSIFVRRLLHLPMLTR
jgi:parallel beta-helix repeat protein